MASISIQDTTLYYEIIGEGIPTVILHGWGVDHTLMSGCLEPVFTQTSGNFKRIYVDLPGMGLSVPGEDIKNSHDILRILYQLLDTLIPDKSFILIGESYGGYLARGMLKERMDSILGLMLLCPLVVPGYRQGSVVPLKVMEQDALFLNTLSKEERDSFTYMNVRLTRDVWVRYKEEIICGIEKQNTNFLNNVLQGEFTYDVDQLDKPYNGPTLIITGKQDTEVGFVDQFELQKSYVCGTYIALAAAGHNAQIEQSVMFTGIATSWFNTYFK